MFEFEMKVALIHIRYIFKGGLETRLFNYIDYFLERGHEVHLFTSKVSEDVKQPPNLHIHLINLKWIPKPIRNFFFDKKLKKVLKRKDFDFILSLERTSRQFHVIAPSTHKGYLEATNKFFYNLVDLLQIYLDKKAFSSAKVVYACSEMVKAEIISYYKINPNQVKVLYPPVNLKNFINLGSKEMALANFNLPANKRYFLLVSTSHKRKGLDLLMKVFQKLNPNNVLLVAGTSFYTNQKNVISLGFVKNIGLLYQAVDVLLHPASYEPFGQIITEAFAAKVPVIVSHKVGAKELINVHRGIIVENYEVNSWVQAIINSDKMNFNFDDIDVLLQEISLEKHMEKMLSWAMIKK